MTAFNQGLLGGCCPCPVRYGAGRRDSTERVPKRLGTAWMHGIGPALGPPTDCPTARRSIRPKSESLTRF
jgi:hypothetical protein